jgi:Na+/H+-dicarboxylate symporter
MDKRWMGRFVATCSAIMALLCLLFILDRLNHSVPIPNEIWALLAVFLGAMGISLPSPFNKE